MTFSTRFNYSKTRTGVESYRYNKMSETNNFSNLYDNNSNRSLKIKKI